MQTIAFNWINQNAGTAITGLVIFIFISGWFFKQALPFLRKLSWFCDDALGEPARKGTPARPGWGERLTKVEEGQTRFETVQQEHTETLAKILEKLDTPTIAPAVHIDMTAPAAAREDTP